MCLLLTFVCGLFLGDVQPMDAPAAGGMQLPAISKTGSYSAEKPLPRTEAPAVGLFLSVVLGGHTHDNTVQNPVPLATWWLHDPGKQKPRYLLDSRASLIYLVPER